MTVATTSSHWMPIYARDGVETLLSHSKIHMVEKNTNTNNNLKETLKWICHCCFNFMIQQCFCRFILARRGNQRWKKQPWTKITRCTPGSALWDPEQSDSVRGLTVRTSVGLQPQSNAAAAVPLQWDQPDVASHDRPLYQPVLDHAVSVAVAQERLQGHTKGRELIGQSVSQLARQSVSHSASESVSQLAISQPVSQSGS